MRLVFEVVGLRKGNKRTVAVAVFKSQSEAEMGLKRLQNDPKYKDWDLSIRKNLHVDPEWYTSPESFQTY